MIKAMWALMGGTTCVVGILAEGGTVTLQAIVFLCGLLSVLFSLTFGALLKHLSSHSEYKDQIDKLIQLLVKEATCDKNRKDCLNNLNLRLKTLEDMLRQVLNDEDKNTIKQA